VAQFRRVVILKGSPRERGNSALLADQVAAGAREAGAQVENIYLHGLDIRPCDACDLCQEEHAEIVGMVYGQAMQAGAIQSQSGLLAQAYQLGQKLGTAN